MSKGKRKSDPNALRIVQQRLQCRSTATFTEQDRALLMQLCRLDLIHILEVDLGLRPLKSQKNSVACMINFLLAQQHERRDVDAVPDTGAAVEQPFRPSQGASSRPQAGSSPAAAGAPVGGSSSGGGSCPTPSTVPDEQQAQEPQQGVQLLPLLQTGPGALAVVAAAAPGVGGSTIEQQPWLAQLHEELEAAGVMRMRLGEDTTDTDDDTTGTGATSSWVASQSGMEPFGEQDKQQYPAAAGGSQALAPGALDTSQIEELLVQQLLLDIHSVPHRHRAHKSSSFNSYQQQLPAGAQQEDEARRQPPLLLQQKLQQLEEQQQMLKELQLQQERQKANLMQQQLQQQQQQLQQQQRLVQGVPAQTDIECMLQDELLRELEARDSSQPLPPQLGSAISMEAQQLALAAAAAELPPAAATEALALQHQQHHQLQQPAAQMASWPLPVVPGRHQGLSAEATIARGLMAGGSGLSDASLPLPGLSWGARRLSGQSAGGSSFTRKREKVLMGLPTVQDGAIIGAAIDTELCVEASGPSAELPTKRMSISLPGCAEVASLPTSFSGRVPTLSGISCPQPGSDLQQLMQFSTYEEPGDMRWQQQQHQLQHLQGQQVQYQQQQQQLPVTQQQQQQQQQQAGVSDLGLAGRLKALLRGHKAKARRHSSVGAGGSFSAAAPDCNRVPSADAAYAYCTAMAAAGSSQPLQPFQTQQQQQQQQQQLGAACQPRAWGVAQSNLCTPTSDLPPAAGGRQWHSAAMAAMPGDSSTTLQAAVGGFSWHPSGSTLLAETGTPAAPTGMMASSSHFAQQLAQLRADYAGQQQAGGSSNLLQDRGLPAVGMRGCAGPSAVPRAVQAGVVGAPGLCHARPGLVDRFVQALRVGAESAQGGMEFVEEQEEDVLIMGRVGGEADPGRGF